MRIGYAFIAAGMIALAACSEGSNETSTPAALFALIRPARRKGELYETQPKIRAFTIGVIIHGNATTTAITRQCRALKCIVGEKAIRDRITKGTKNAASNPNSGTPARSLSSRRVLRKASTAWHTTETAYNGNIRKGTTMAAGKKPKLADVSQRGGVNGPMIKAQRAIMISQAKLIARYWSNALPSELRAQPQSGRG